MFRTRRLLVASAICGLLALTACTGSDRPPQATPAKTPAPRDQVEIKDAVLIASSNGSAILTAKVANRTGSQLGLLDAEFDGLTSVINVHGDATIAASRETTLGRFEEDSYRVQVLEDARPGTQVTGTLTFGPSDELHKELPPTKFTASVVARSADNDDLLGVPTNAIQVKDAVIVVVPGQKRAYVGGKVVSKINDLAGTLPTAVNAQGEPVKYRHQTATGGPYGISADKKTDVTFGGPPYRVPEAEQIGDADYFNSADVAVGETITVTIPFQSGDVTAAFRVIAG